MRIKKLHLILIISVLAAAVLIVSCSTVNQIFGSPELAVEGFSIKSLDLEGITFNMDYAITNPYPLGFSLKSMAANVAFENTILTKLSANEGITVASMDKSKNSVAFKIPYTTIINLAKNIVSGSGAAKRTSLPFSVDGKAELDLSALSSILENQSMTLPFSKNFEVPIFKPSISIGNVKLQMPTISVLQNAFTSQGGMSLTTALSLANSIMSGSSVAETIFDNIDINLNLSFDIDVESEGSAAWKYVLEKCSLQSVAGGTLLNVTPTGSNTITSGGKIPMTATLNTKTAGKFIAQILNKANTDLVFNLDSDLTFTDLPEYVQNLPLSYSKTLPLSSIRLAK
ncbi:MAG: LEA type 2 family protein [Spirochaetaceae bacterium]|nr:LEA type 2 family protein [Spirochaetaceae bacterium]MBO7486013.1 LEA type 2 family protein [Spirochaetaceae bacterium]